MLTGRLPPSLSNPGCPFRLWQAGFQPGVDIQLPRPSRDRLGPSERGVEFFDRAAPGLDPDHQIGDEREHVPDREIVEAGDGWRARDSGIP
jgi:hypothetical protein